MERHTLISHLSPRAHFVVIFMKSQYIKSVCECCDRQLHFADWGPNTGKNSALLSFYSRRKDKNIKINSLPSSSSFLSRRKYCILSPKTEKFLQNGDLQNGDVARQSRTGSHRGLIFEQRILSSFQSSLLRRAGVCTRRTNLRSGPILAVLIHSKLSKRNENRAWSQVTVELLFV